MSPLRKSGEKEGECKHLRMGKKPCAMSVFRQVAETHKDTAPDKAAVGYLYGWKKLGWLETKRVLISSTASVHPGWVGMYPHGTNTYWTEAPVEAKCHCSGQLLDASHVSPVFRCSCGIYAFRIIEELLDNSHGIAFYEPVVRVKCWGKIVDHMWGFRAQYAQISRLVIPYTPKSEKLLAKMFRITHYDWQAEYAQRMTEALQGKFPLHYFDPRVAENEVVDFYSGLEELDATPAQQIPLSEVPQEELDKYLQR